MTRIFRAIALCVAFLLSGALPVLNGVAEATPPSQQQTKNRAKKPTAKKRSTTARAKSTAKRTTKKRGVQSKRSRHGSKKSHLKKHRRVVRIAKPDPNAPAIDPYRVSVSYATLRTAIAKAKRLLRPAAIGTDVVTARNAVLAVWQPDRDPTDIRLVYVREGESQTLGFDVEAQVWNGLSPTAMSIRFNGVNTYYTVSGEHRPGDTHPWLALAIKTHTRAEKNVIYAPYNPAYQTEEIADEGRKYVEEAIIDAEDWLTEHAVVSRSLPGKMLADAIDDRVLLTLLVIEHTDVEESVTRGAGWAADKMFVTMALNREDTYAHAISSAQAMGLAQFIPSTYRAVHRLYPDAALPSDFRKGMLSHTFAIVAQFCLADVSQKAMVDAGISLPDSPILLGTYLAAAYNAGEGKAVPAYMRHKQQCHEEKDGLRWCELPHGLPGETHNYINKFEGTFAYLFPNDPAE